MAGYLRAPGDGAPVHRAFAIAVLRIEDGRIADMVAFHEPARPAFGLPDTVPGDGGEHFPASPPSQHGS